MTDRQLAGLLSELAQLDANAGEAYWQAMLSIDVLMVRDALGDQRAEHARRRAELGRELARLDRGRAPHARGGVKGRALGTLAALRALAGRTSALHALRDAERLLAEMDAARPGPGP
jgi:hypothetical protein